MAGNKVVIDAGLLAGGVNGEIDEQDTGAARFEEWLKPGEGRMHLGFEHDIGVKDDIDRPAVEGDRFPVRQRRLTAELVGSPPVPHPEEGHGAAAVGDEAVAFFDTFGHEQGSVRVGQGGPGKRDVRPAPCGCPEASRT